MKALRFICAGLIIMFTTAIFPLARGRGGGEIQEQDAQAEKADRCNILDCD